MYGTQARPQLFVANGRFENDVKMYGTQAQPRRRPQHYRFENDVKMYGTQAVLGLMSDALGV